MVMRFVIFFLPFMMLFPAEIPQGTHVLLRMVNAISSRTAREGDRVYLRTASPIVVNGQFVVPVDSYAEGVVSHSVRSGRVKGRAELGIHVNSFTLPTGETLRVSPQLSSIDSAGTEQKVETTKENEIRQGGSKGQDAERIAVTSG